MAVSEAREKIPIADQEFSIDKLDAAWIATTLRRETKMSDPTTIELTGRIERRDGVYLSRIEELDLFTYADTMEDVLKLTIEVIRCHFDTCKKMGTLDNVLASLIRGNRAQTPQSITLSIETDMRATDTSDPWAFKPISFSPQFCSA